MSMGLNRASADAYTCVKHYMYSKSHAVSLLPQCSKGRRSLHLATHHDGAGLNLLLSDRGNSHMFRGFRGLGIGQLKDTHIRVYMV
jgi:hypothetical protein